MSLTIIKYLYEDLLYNIYYSVIKICLRAGERSVGSCSSVAVFFVVADLGMKLDKTIGCGDLDRSFHARGFFPVTAGRKFSATEYK